MGPRKIDVARQRMVNLLLAVSLILAPVLLTSRTEAADGCGGGVQSPVSVLGSLRTLDESELAAFALPFALMARDSKSPSANRAQEFGYSRGANSPALFAASDPAAVPLAA